VVAIILIYPAEPGGLEQKKKKKEKLEIRKRKENYVKGKRFSGFLFTFLRKLGVTYTIAVFSMKPWEACLVWNSASGHSLRRIAEGWQLVEGFGA